MPSNKIISTDAPEIIWHSDPVKPNETIVINGYAFSKSSKIELCRLMDDEGEKCEATLEPLVATSDSIKVVVPEAWIQGVYACKVINGKQSSRTVLVNAPDIWWQQGEGGVDTVIQGGWLRLFGKCLSFDLKPQVKLVADKKEIALEVKEYSQYSVEIIIPEDIDVGEYRLVYNNGYGGEDCFVNIDSIFILPKQKNNQKLFNVLDFGADPTGKKDSTLPIVAAIEHLGGFGGGVVYFPAGRYRIDSILRSGVYIKTPLKVPQNVTLRGESMELVSLWWPDQDGQLPSLIEGGSSFGIEELTIYTQGKHSTIITGESNVVINRVRIRANCYYMTNNNGGRHHGRMVDVDFKDTSLGSAFAIWGDSLKITNCDIYTSNVCFDVKHCSGGYIANNTVMAKNFFSLSGCSEFILENNKFTGNQLTAGGSNFALHFGARVCEHTYLAHNTISHIYGGDHEAFTLDGHGNSYFGKVKNIEANTLTLCDSWYKNVKQKGYMCDSQGMALFIVEGKGRGQYRWIENYNGEDILLDSPWLVEPDETSLVSVSAFNGHHLIIGNIMSDTGTAVQLYPPNHECIVAENKTYRASNINSMSRLRKDKINGSIWCELSWYNQFLDNEIVEGNCWGGGSTEVDRWIGGESCLNIWGMQLHFYTDEFGAGQGGFVSAEVVKDVLKESEVRLNSIPLSLFTIVRRHKIHNNSSIRVRARVSEVLIENCQIANSACGIRIDSEVQFEMPSDLGQLFDFDPKDVEVLNFLSPDQVLVKNNNFHNVKSEYCGNALNNKTIKKI